MNKIPETHEEYKKLYDAHLKRLMGKGFTWTEAHANADYLANQGIEPTVMDAERSS